MDIPEEYTRKYTKEEINRLPLRRFTGPIHLVRSEQELAYAWPRLAEAGLLGFDTESKPVFQKGTANPPALLQLATSEAVFIFQFNLLPFPEQVRDILADPSVVKAGVAVWDDVKGLQQLSPFEAGGFVDLGDVSRGLDLQTNGLRNLAANLLGFRISKSAQRSNWGRKDLSDQQIVYAATDAWVSRELYLAIRSKGWL